MRFIDEAKIKVKAGDGGNGCISFFRGSHMPKGGPDGGDGGRGASIYFEASENLQTLLDFRYKREYEGDRGEHGMGSDCYGRKADDLVLLVPVGTMVTSEDGEIEADLAEHGQRLLVAKGGSGGLGNIHFKSSTHQAPRVATSGKIGEERELKLELKVLSDVGLVGFPNAGKSSLLSVLTAATPKVADYPFTTLTPQLGVFDSKPVFDRDEKFIIADIPGLIPGAHQNFGLGHKFLRHVSRSSLLLYVVSFDRQWGLEENYQKLRLELQLYDHRLLERNSLICINKIDLLEDSGVESDVREGWQKEYEEFLLAHPGTVGISALHRRGLAALQKALTLGLLSNEPRVLDCA